MLEGGNPLAIPRYSRPISEESEKEDDLDPPSQSHTRSLPASKADVQLPALPGTEGKPPSDAADYPDGRYVYVKRADHFYEPVSDEDEAKSKQPSPKADTDDGYLTPLPSREPQSPCEQGLHRQSSEPVSNSCTIQPEFSVLQRHYIGTENWS